MRIYLDNCCYNRPYDSTSDVYVKLEKIAKLEIQKRIENNKYELATSYILEYECNKNKKEVQRGEILNFIDKNCKYHIDTSHKDEIRPIAEEIMLTGVHELDAYHVAAAIFIGCKYFITTDKRILKYQTDKIKIVNPIDFLNEERQ